MADIPNMDGLWPLVKSIVANDVVKVREIIERTPELAKIHAAIGASRSNPSDYFFPAIRHYSYAGDTALHMAAAGFRVEMARILIERGASCDARNRRGAQPLHYASDSNTWNPAAQAATIDCLIQAGADPNSSDKSGVAPIHRAVRTRCAAAVEALLRGGAQPNLRNKSGSMPLHLAVRNTGRGGTGTPESIEQQRLIILLLLQSGANPGNKDGSGKTAAQLATAPWMRELLLNATSNP